jgi:hypothetical protein
MIIRHIHEILLVERLLTGSTALRKELRKFQLQRSEGPSLDQLR